MVEHVRKAIRAAAVSDLTGLATTGANVFTSRLSPLEAVEMPGWYVMLRDETADEDTLSTYARTGRLVIEGWALANDDIEDLLDRMAAEAEAAIYDPAGTLLPLLQNYGPPTTQLETPQPDVGVGEGIGKVRIMFPVTYRTAIADPTTRV